MSSAFLLDINVLIALMDADHVHHEQAHRWFAEIGHAAWATCPTTENGVVRILSNPRYRLTSTSSALVAQAMREFCKLDGHSFWVEDSSTLGLKTSDTTSFRAEHITDLHLLNLAVKNGGRLATFDRRIPCDLVPDGRAHLLVLS